MNEKIKVLYYALWIAHPVLQMGIAAIMLRRGLHRQIDGADEVSTPVALNLAMDHFWRGLERLDDIIGPAQQDIVS